MPTTDSRKLTLTRVGEDKVKIEVTYNAVFSVFERRMIQFGLVFKEQIAVIGVDPPGSTTGTVLANFEPEETIPVTDGDVPQPILRSRTLVVDRTLLQEDPAVGDADEIRCRIQIAAIGLPPGVTPDEFTDEQVLFG